jgi:hypothetical protein
MTIKYPQLALVEACLGKILLITGKYKEYEFEPAVYTTIVKSHDHRDIGTSGYIILRQIILEQDMSKLEKAIYSLEDK